MHIRKATVQDCRAVAELALIAGEGIPAYFWEQSKTAGQDVVDVGAENLTSDTENFSYRNVHVIVSGDDIAGMLLAYRLPEAKQAEGTEEYPDFIRPLIELEQCVPGSFYINMLAAFPRFRNQGVGTRLMSIADRLANEAGCNLLSVEVFEQNEGAVRLYQRLGYEVIAHRPVVPHACHPYSGRILLLTRTVNPTP